MTREEKIICKHFLDDADKTHSCNEYKLLMALLEQEPTTKNETLVSLGVYKQVAWERDIAIQQLHELGYEFGQKIEPTTKNDLGGDTPENNVGNMDCISRAQTQTEIEMNASRYTIARERGGMGQVEWSDQLIKVSDAVDIIKNLPPVTPQDIDYKAQYERLSQKAEIVISQLRADRDRLMSLTSVTPIRPKGHWIDTKENSTNTRGQIINEVICSECNGIAYFRSIGNKYIGANTCPNCGADMREVVEE